MRTGFSSESRCIFTNWNNNSEIHSIVKTINTTAYRTRLTNVWTIVWVVHQIQSLSLRTTRRQQQVYLLAEDLLHKCSLILLVLLDLLVSWVKTVAEKRIVLWQMESLDFPKKGTFQSARPTKHRRSGCLVGSLLSGVRGSNLHYLTVRFIFFIKLKNKLWSTLAAVLRAPFTLEKLLILLLWT